MANINAEAMKKNLKAAGVCEKISKISIYVLVFLLPIFFLPWTSSVLDFNKQALLVFLVSIAIFSRLVKALVLGKFEISFSWLYIPLAIFIAVYFVSSVFSWWPYGSFWGWPQPAGESFISLFYFGLFAVLAINTLGKKEMMNIAILACLSGLLAMLVGILQAFGKFLLPFNFTQDAGFNTVGTMNSLAIFSAGIIPLIIAFLASGVKKYFKIFFAACLAMALALLVIVNFPTAWILTMLGATLAITFGCQKRDSFEGRWIILPMFILALASMFFFFKFKLPGLPATPVELSISQRAGFNIAKEALKGNLAIIGSGPGTFIYDFSKFKSQDFNQTQFWNVRFGEGSSKILTLVPTIGILGALSFLGLMGAGIYFGVVALLRKKKGDTEIADNEEITPSSILPLRRGGGEVGGILPKEGEEEGGGEMGEKGAKGKKSLKKGIIQKLEGGAIFTNLGVGVFAGFIVICVAYFFGNSNLALDFLWFLFVAILAGLYSPLKKTVLLKSSSLAGLGITFALTAVFIFSLGIFIMQGQRYAAEVYFAKGEQLIQQGKNEQAISAIENAVRINSSSDLYLRELSQAYLNYINEVLAKKDITQEQASQTAKALIGGAVNSVKAATDLNAKNVANWSVRGFIYQNLIGIVGGSGDWSVKAYEEALNLEPANPYFLVQSASSAIKDAGLLAEDKKTEKAQLIETARIYLEKAIALKQDYALAHLQLALLYETQEKKEEALNEMILARNINLSDADVAFQLGAMLYRQADYANAVLELGRVVSMSPNHSNALYLLALSYDKTDKKDDAIEAMKKVVSLNPDNAQVAKILENLKAGKPALSGIGEEAPVAPVAPSPEGESPEGSK